MITSIEAKQKVKEYELAQELKMLMAIEQVKQETIDWCNSILSEKIGERAESGFTNMQFDCANYGTTVRDCVSVVEYGTNSKGYGYYTTKNTIHPETMIEYIQKHGFTVTKTENRYDVSPTTAKKMVEGLRYRIEWA